MALPGAAVDLVLAERVRRAESGGGRIVASVGAALLVHASIVVLAILLPRLAPPPKPLDYVPVDVIPAQALGVPKPAPRTQPQPAEAPKPTPPAPQTPPAAKPEPVKPKAEEPPPRPTPQAPVLPIHEVRTKPQPVPPIPPKPEPQRAAPPRPAAPAAPPSRQPPGSAAPDATGEANGRRGSLTGNPTSSAAFGSQVAGIDPDFTYGYYVDQLLSRIDQNWVRPPADNRVHAVLSFRIQRDGSLADLQVRETSGSNTFDLAALRAVQNAAPFPPLPRAYVQSSLGVSLIVR